jgi:hypothetical protein
MPASGSDAPNVRDELARIRAEVESGNADLKALGFWKLVGRVKRDRALIQEFADEIGAIDRLAFERRFRFRPPVWLGNLVLVLGKLAMVALFFVAMDLADPFSDFWRITVPSSTGEVIAFEATISPWVGWLLLAVAGGLSVVVHDLAHWAVGRLGGIRFTSYFLDGPFRIQPGIKTDYATYLRATPMARAWMHAAGAVASKLAPFVVLLGIYVKGGSSFALVPAWTKWAILALGIGQILTDVIWSTKKSDWKKFARERRLARDLYSNGTPGSSGQPG